MENKIINEIKRVGSILFISITFFSLFFTILILVNIGKAHTQNEQIIEQNKQIIELIQEQQAEKGE